MPSNDDDRSRAEALHRRNRAVEVRETTNGAADDPSDRPHA